MALDVIWVRMPDIQTSPNARPRQCPYCGSYILQRWGRIAKPVRDTHELEVEVHRYRCCDCGRTFRAYPQGVDRSERSIRLRNLAALTWALGLSLEKVVHLFTTFGVNLSRTTIWRDGQKMVSSLPNGRRAKTVKVLSSGNNGVWIDQHEGGVVIVLELKRSKKVLLEMVDESNLDSVQQMLSPIVSGWGLEMDIF
jgi:DNA-directed RNA polymerase subunit RPC12/RpoP